MSAPRRTAPKPGAAPVPAPLPGAARAILVVLAAALALALVSFPLYDTDLWQHLAVGRSLWNGNGLPHVNTWTWPTHGQPDLTPSWLFRAALWPFYALGGIPGLFVWRWLTTLAAFALLLAAARAGARPGDRGAPTGGVALLALLWCAIPYRYRSQDRPETLVAVILAAELWVLESWRAGRGGRRLWLLPALACVWANAHISYYLGLVLGAIYFVDALFRSRFRRGGPPARELLLPLAASAAASFLNPYGWRALAQPFEYFLVWRHEPIYRTIGELAPIDWAVYAHFGLPVLLALIAALALGRLARGRADVAQLAVLAVFLPQALATQRFLGYLALLAAPYFARDLSAALGAVRWPAALGRPWARAGLAAAAMIALATPALTREPLVPGIGVRWNMTPRRACEYVAEHDVRGRVFNTFAQGGYLLWHFWPDPLRLPFMDIHQTGTREDRRLYALALGDSAAWSELDRRHRFEWILLSRVPHERTPLLDRLDADTARWALVFVDDAAAVYVRREGDLAAIAAADRYVLLPAGTARLGMLGAAVYADSAIERAARAELERACAASPWNGGAELLLANLDLSHARWTDALARLDRARSAAPFLAGVEERRGLALLALGKPKPALAAFERERRLNPAWDAGDRRLGQAYAALGERERAARAYRAALAKHPGDREAADSLAALGR